MEKFYLTLTIASCVDYIHSKGFTFTDALIKNFYISLRTKPFVLLAGISGTGKTRLVRLFAEAVGAAGDGRYLQVPVRPDWSDSSDLFGHRALDGSFRKGPILDFIIKANQNLDKPYFLCLDEMNLARVEYYFSDFLSVLETRDYKDGIIKSVALVPDIFNSFRETLNESEKKSIPSSIYFSENLYIVGTVNMDESTFPFSKKVLDRAMTIEFSDVDLKMDSYFDEIPSEAKAINVDNALFKSLYVNPKDIPAGKQTDAKETAEKLERYNNILKKAQLHVGYRVRNEIIFYVSYAKDAGFGSDAMDYAIMQKILPRIQGSSAAIKNVLIELYTELRGLESGSLKDDSKLIDNIADDLEKNDKPMSRSAEKIFYMLTRMDEDGYTAYWL